ncbi:MAG TPA: hypothetical protein VIQ26_03145, partial [Microbacteriaceae bacterium]
MTQYEAPQDARAADPDSGRLTAAFARHPRAWMATALAAVFLLLGTGSVFAGTLVAADKPAP